MATATAPVTTATPVLTTAQEMEELNKQIEPINSEISKFKASLFLEQNALASLTAQYDEQCRSLALGQTADPQATQRSIGEVSAKIQGLKSVLDEAFRKHQPLAAKHHELSLRIVDEKELGGIHELGLAQAAAQKLADEARAHWVDLDAKDHQLRSQRDTARRARENRLTELRKQQGLR